MIPNSSLIVSSSEPTGNNRKKVWMQKGKNLFDKNNFSSLNGYLDSNANKFVASPIRKILYIPCSKNTTYTVTKTLGYRFSVGNSSTISTSEFNLFSVVNNNSATSITITTGESAKYLLVWYYDSQGDTKTEQEILDSIQIEQGSTATEYEAYIEPKIYVKNDNDVYEEFISKESDLEKTNYFKEYYSNSSLSAQANDTVDVYTAEDIYLTGKDLLITTSIAVYVTTNMWVLFVCIDGKDYELSNGDNTSMQFKTTQVILRELEKGTHKISFKLKSLGNGIAYLSGHNRMSFTAIEL